MGKKASNIKPVGLIKPPPPPAPPRKVVDKIELVFIFNNEEG